MPKGVKVKTKEAPEVAHCDFCGQPFKPDKWNSRTCLRCFGEGAPDQGRMDWGPYQKALADWLRLKGRKAALSGGAALARAGQLKASRQFRGKNGPE